MMLKGISISNLNIKSTKFEQATITVNYRQGRKRLRENNQGRETLSLALGICKFHQSYLGLGQLNA